MSTVEEARAIRPNRTGDRLAKETLMRFRKIFRRSALSEAGPSPAIGSSRHEQASVEELADLEEAWADLNQAAEEAGVISFRACTRDGSPWQNDPEAVRRIVAMIKESDQGRAITIDSDRT